MPDAITYGQDCNVSIIEAFIPTGLLILREYQATVNSLVLVILTMT